MINALCKFNDLKKILKIKILKKYESNKSCPKANYIIKNDKKFF